MKKNIIKEIQIQKLYSYINMERGIVVDYEIIKKYLKIWRYMNDRCKDLYINGHASIISLKPVSGLFLINKSLIICRIKTSFNDSYRFEFDKNTSTRYTLFSYDEENQLHEVKNDYSHTTGVGSLLTNIIRFSLQRYIMEEMEKNNEVISKSE